MSISNAGTPPGPDSVGHGQPTAIKVELSTRFLEHFSEQLYSSPQKAFEELISNGWDAGADRVDVWVSENLSAPDATMAVLDNGVSMDLNGLRQLWRIAFSAKKAAGVQHGRQLIGKFGIGKLATYVLAKKLTYICRAADGIIRRVTMNYGEIDKQKQDSEEDHLLSQLTLDVYEVSEAELEESLRMVDGGNDLLDLIKSDMPAVAVPRSDNEFGTELSAVKRSSAQTWTLAVLSDLKSVGRDLKIGILRRMLEAALPFESEMAITLNGTLLESSKIALATLADWTIGPDLDINEIELDVEGPQQTQTSKIPVTSSETPFPHVAIPGIGRITGRVRLFVDPVSGGKSEERGRSNGFYVNVLGRVVNQHDASFGEKNLSHASWARFRMAVRADGLNEFLTTNREQFRDQYELRIFRAFLRKVFNKARVVYDSDANAILPDGGDVLVQSLGVLSLSPLRNVVSAALRGSSPLDGLFDDSGIGDRDEKLRSWRENTAKNIRNALDEVRYETIRDDSFVTFRIADSSIIVNKEHPFVAEFSRTKAEKELLRTVAMVYLLSDVYALEVGVQPSALASIREYRDRLMRFRALRSRKSGTYIAKLLLQQQHNSAHSKHMEMVVSDALRYLGFEVRDLAKPGQPEGIASAYATPSSAIPTKQQPNPPLYSVSFDAKSSKYEVASTGNIKLDGVAQHRKKFEADYALIIAPGFEKGAITTRCEEQRVTPMTGHELGRLLEYTVEYGAIPLTKLRELFSIHDPDKVTEWVGALEAWIRSQRSLTIDVFLKALANLKGKVPDVLPAGLLAFQCREVLGAFSVRDEDVIAVARGLAILVPDLVGITDDKIVVNASAAHVAAAVAAQLEKLRDDSTADDDSDGGASQ
jgi:hypothetical protein